MSYTPTIYTFEDEHGVPTEFHTTSYDEAKEYARKYGLAVISNEYEWVDSEMVDDYRPENLALIEGEHT